MLVCIDSNCLSYIIDAMTRGEKPDGDLADEKLALLRAYLYLVEPLCVTPTVRAENEGIENEGIEDEQNRQNHQRMVDILLREVMAAEADEVELRSCEYAKLHRGKKKVIDCQILAEAELGGCEFFLTYDKRFLKNLRGRTHNIEMMTPSEFWERLTW